MNLFTKPCGCRGIGFLKSTRGSFTLRKLYVNNPDDNLERRNPLEGNTSPCASALRGEYPTYSSTDLIEIQEEKDIEQREGFCVEKTLWYFLYGCLKCGETWREHYKTKTGRNWKE